MEDKDLAPELGASDHGCVSRLDLTSGFMKHIIRNQQRRDDYDKEVRVMQEQQKTTAKENKNHARKPGQSIYVPPAKASKGNGRINDYDKNVFKLQYEAPDREVSEWLVHKGDDPHGIAERFGRQCRLSSPLIKALGSFIEEEMDKRGLHT
ncbi:UPF0561 protein C2orf68 [Strongylocentrotus purpuratus]|uniref:Uncharacterized protein n=1 Tax=Strongylocentrotus purpuratus TaxID=7668 RepID=A0A7M7NED3_STRPU|nr:UPF0561 protein C2orf68 [Strongylocentrotus purpuratus]